MDSECQAVRVPWIDGCYLSQAQAQLGFVYNQQQMFNEALVPLKAALSLFPDDDSAHVSMLDARAWLAVPRRMVMRCCRSALWEREAYHNQRMAYILSYEVGFSSVWH